jgi:hypothetical protein
MNKQPNNVAIALSPQDEVVDELQDFSEKWSAVWSVKPP